jgi:uncharacterized protein YdhG (YjbR/CyaY superfamily)
MALAKRKPTTIDGYLRNVKADQRRALEGLRRVIRDVAPDSKECISYGIPAFRVDGRALVFFGAWGSRCSFYPGSSAALKDFQNDLKEFQTSKGTIRFSPDKPLPTALVKKLVQARMAENGAKRLGESVSSRSKPQQ